MAKTSEQLYKMANELMEEAKKLEEEEIMECGCHVCNGELDEARRRRTITMVWPCSEGHVHETYILCTDCFWLIYKIVKKE